ncbi:hypothetical protein [Nostoc sp.]
MLIISEAIARNQLSILQISSSFVEISCSEFKTPKNQSDRSLKLKSDR